MRAAARAGERQEQGARNRECARAEVGVGHGTFGVADVRLCMVGRVGDHETVQVIWGLARQKAVIPREWRAAPMTEGTHRESGRVLRLMSTRPDQR